MHAANAELRSDNNKLRELLAIVNADGGHRAQEVGIKQAVEEAISKYHGMILQIHGSFSDDQLAIKCRDMELQLRDYKNLVNDIRDAVNEECHSVVTCEGYESLNTAHNCPACNFEYKLKIMDGGPKPQEFDDCPKCGGGQDCYHLRG